MIIFYYLRTNPYICFDKFSYLISIALLPNVKYSNCNKRQWIEKNLAGEILMSIYVYGTVHTSSKMKRSKEYYNIVLVESSQPISPRWINNNPSRLYLKATQNWIDLGMTLPLFSQLPGLNRDKKTNDVFHLRFES